jgi:hypothetical protein
MFSAALNIGNSSPAVVFDRVNMSERNDRCLARTSIASILMIVAITRLVLSSREFSGNASVVARYIAEQIFGWHLKVLFSLFLGLRCIRLRRRLATSRTIDTVRL